MDRQSGKEKNGFPDGFTMMPGLYAKIRMPERDGRIHFHSSTIFSVLGGGRQPTRLPKGYA